MAVMEREETRAFNYYFEILPVEQLFADERYQRAQGTFVGQIVRRFNPALVGCLIVSERDDGTFAIIDGQTRHAALVKIGVTHIPCLIYEGMSAQEEATLFALFQSERKNMTAYDRFKAELFAGLPRAVAIEKIVKRAGFSLVRSTQAKGINAIRGLEIAHDAYGSATMLTMLMTFKKAFPDQTPESAMIRGFSRLVYEERTKDGFEERFMKALDFGFQNPERNFLEMKKAISQEGAGNYSAGTIFMHAYTLIKRRYEDA